MLRKHWREARFWVWIWRERVRREAKALIGVVLIGLMLAGGWLAASRLSTASAGVTQFQAFTFETTVQRMVTVREKGKIVRKLVPVVKKVFVKRRTKFKTTTDVQTQVITRSGGVRTVRTKLIVHVPVVSKQVVTVNGKTKTIVTTRLVPTTNIETQTSTLTRTQTQTQVQVQVQVQTQVQTQTQTSTVTTTKTVTQPVTLTQPVTVTQPAVTTTRTVTTTQTVPVTVTVTQTQTLTVTT